MPAHDPDDGGEVFLEALLLQEARISLHALVCDFRWRGRDLGFDVFVCRFWNLDLLLFAVVLLFYLLFLFFVVFLWDITRVT